MTVIIDYGVGNLFSLTSSFQALGADVTVSSSPDVIRSADRLVLPGVGAFRDAREKLLASGLDRVIIEEVKKGKKLVVELVSTQYLKVDNYLYIEESQKEDLLMLNSKQFMQLLMLVN